MPEMYKRRSESNLQFTFANPILTQFIFESTRATLSRCGISEKIHTHWASAMSAGTSPPSLPYHFVQWEDFEKYVQDIFDRNSRTILALRRLRK